MPRRFSGHAEAMTVHVSIPPSLLAGLAARAATGRVILGIAGPPGSGKTTLARAVVTALAQDEPPVTAVHVPQDGFHLPNAELERLGLRDRKGTPETFDAAAFADLLQALRDNPDADAEAPDYDRTIHEPVPGRIAIPASARVIIADGLYVTYDEGDWARVRDCLDGVWWLDVPWDLARERLDARHVAGGRAPDDASAWADRVDATTTALVAGGRERADAVLTWRDRAWEIA